MGIPLNKFTPEFRRWFKGSAVVNSDGSPHIVVHGTVSPVAFTEFLIGQRPNLEGDEDVSSRGSGADPLAYIGAHFSDSPVVAGKFAKGLYGERAYSQGVHGRIIPVYLRIKKPFRATEDEMMEAIWKGNYNARPVERELENWPIGGKAIWSQKYDSKEHDALFEKYEKDPVFRWEVNKSAMEMEGQTDEDNFFELSQEMGNSFREKLEKKGFDGIIYPNSVEGGESYIIFDSSQAKSIYNQRPTSGQRITNPFRY